MSKIYECLIIIFHLCLFIHIYTDFKEQLLYDVITILLIFSGIVYAFVFENWFDALLGACISVGIMFIIYWLSRGGMGFGDVKLALALGVWLGLEEGLLCLLIGFILGGFVGVLLLVTGIKSRKDAIPFGPFLCLGGWVSKFYGNEILLWYWNLF